eukprot:Platyproteum_vivax@DN10172_c0_g1_i1.p1
MSKNLSGSRAWRTTPGGQNPIVKSTAGAAPLFFATMPVADKATKVVKNAFNRERREREAEEAAERETRETGETGGPGGPEASEGKGEGKGKGPQGDREFKKIEEPYTLPEKVPTLVTRCIQQKAVKPKMACVGGTVVQGECTIREEVEAEKSCPPHHYPDPANPSSCIDKTCTGMHCMPLMPLVHCPEGTTQLDETHMNSRCEERFTIAFTPTCPNAYTLINTSEDDREEWGAKKCALSNFQPFFLSCPPDHVLELKFGDTCVAEMAADALWECDGGELILPDSPKHGSSKCRRRVERPPKICPETFEFGTPEYLGGFKYDEELGKCLIQFSQDYRPKCPKGFLFDKGQCVSITCPFGFGLTYDQKCEQVVAMGPKKTVTNLKEGPTAKFLNFAI